MKAKEKISTGEILAIAIIFDRGNDRYILTTDTLRADYKARQRFVDINKNNVFLSGFHAEDSWEKSRWFVFYSADCAFPPQYLIRANSWEEAYEAFCDEFSDILKIADGDLADYGENVNYSASGVPIDTESVQGEELTLSQVICQ